MGFCALQLSPVSLYVPRALLYLQELAEELTSAYQPSTQGTSESPLEPGEPARKRRGRKPHEQKLENDGDADFVPSEEGLVEAAEEEEESDLLLSEASEPEPEQSLQGAAVTQCSSTFMFRGPSCLILLRQR